MGLSKDKPRISYLTQQVKQYLTHKSDVFDKNVHTFGVKLLPFMKSKEGSVSAKPDTLKRSSDEENKDSDVDMLELVVKELFEAKTDKARAEAFRAAFQLLENEPHEEIDHGKLSDS